MSLWRSALLSVTMGVVLYLAFGRVLAQDGEMAPTYLPVVARPQAPTPTPTATTTPTATPLPTATPIPTATTTPVPADYWLAHVNHYRAIAGVPPVTEDIVLNDNCFRHARYTAENKVLAHSEDPALPWYSPEGADCAQKGNVWMAWGDVAARSTPKVSIDAWMTSVGHRLWLLYPTTQVFGYGFYYSGATGHAGAALDVKSGAQYGDDEAYEGWPVKYPAPGQRDVALNTGAITLNWSIFGEIPFVTATRLTTADGATVDHATSTFGSGAKGIQITPDAPYLENTTYTVAVEGYYLGEAFFYEWHFTTGSAASH